MFKFFLANKDGKPVEVQAGLDDSPALIAESLRTLRAHWQTSSITTATTTTIICPRSNAALLLTDLIIILSKKVASATIITRFTDGTNTENLITFDAATASFEFSHAFQGGLRAWKDAEFQIVTNQTTTIAVFVAYMHISEKSSLEFGAWDAIR